MNKCFDGIIEDLETWNEYTGRDQWNAVYTIQLGELINCGVFDWNYSLLNWKNAAYDDEQYRRVCDYFVERFYYREISIEPFDEWARMLRSRLVFELMPKYRILYAQREREWDIASGGKESGKSDNYYKARTIKSEYPETLLSNNADYITDGTDTEDQRIIEDERNKTVDTATFIDTAESYATFFYQLDKRLLDELETFFISMYTTNVNATW